MAERSQPPTWNSWQGWSTISAGDNIAFTIWFTGLPGTGKTTQAHLLQKSLITRGYKVEIINSHTLSRWIQQELHVEEHTRDDYSHTIGYDAFITYICSLLARNSIVTISTSVSPLIAARNFAREQLRQFIEVYLSCPNEQRYQRLRQQEHVPLMSDQVYEPPLTPELALDTTNESAERSTLRILSYLEHHSYIAPLWDTIDDDEEDEIETIKARLKALGYLE